MSQEWIKLNVGGKIYHTSRTTLLKDENSMIYKMFSQDENYISPGKIDQETGCFLIDR
jgi:BTB/POZ domain